MSRGAETRLKGDLVDCGGGRGGGRLAGHGDEVGA